MPVRKSQALATAWDALGKKSMQKSKRILRVCFPEIALLTTHVRGCPHLTMKGVSR